MMPDIFGSITAMFAMLSLRTCLSNKKTANPFNPGVSGARVHISVQVTPQTFSMALTFLLHTGVRLEFLTHSSVGSYKR